MSPAAFAPPLPAAAPRAHSRAHARIRCTASTPPTAAAAATTPSRSATMQRFLNWFRGDFDNYYQAAHDRSSGVPYSLIHEHIHCRLQPLSHEQLVPRTHAAVFATYHYNGNADIVYRRRLYTLEDVGDALEMRIYKMSFIHGLVVAKANGHFDSLHMGCVLDSNLYEHLEGSQIVWRYEPEPHAGSGFVANGAHFVGSMRDGGFVSRDSLRYEDELVLTKEDLWVAERVYNKDGVMVGGNRDRIPHKMRRVRRDDEIKWTMDLSVPEIDVPE
eukprot:TRINITY_DN57688_c0_g1_i1.p1 TRINITY_DN57688_c0_g1~~TRINITY_DN57688_c0_g1_i1.p1  ORF type:complete len:307 (+),score=68.95 TRINITY_DN57688_c0_g1_i1:104-922(+)